MIILLRDCDLFPFQIIFFSENMKISYMLYVHKIILDFGTSIFDRDIKIK
jgi:hypothetical protein